MKVLILQHFEEGGYANQVLTPNRYITTENLDSYNNEAWLLSSESTSGKSKMTWGNGWQFSWFSQTMKCKGPVRSGKAQIVSVPLRAGPQPL